MAHDASGGLATNTPGSGKSSDADTDSTVAGPKIMSPADDKIVTVALGGGGGGVGGDGENVPPDTRFVACSAIAVARSQHEQFSQSALPLSTHATQSAAALQAAQHPDTFILSITPPCALFEPGAPSTPGISFAHVSLKGRTAPAGTASAVALYPMVFGGRSRRTV